MNPPVPPAHVLFMRSSSPPVRNSILESSPPISMATSASGMKRASATRAAMTSCVNGRSSSSANCMPADPVTPTVIFSQGK